LLIWSHPKAWYRTPHSGAHPWKCLVMQAGKGNHTSLIFAHFTGPERKQSPLQDPVTDASWQVRVHNLQKNGHNSREIPTGELYELRLVNSESFTKQKNPPWNEIYRPYCGGKLQPRRLASVLHVHFSECFTKHLIPYWSVSFTQKEITTGPLLPSLLAYCKNFLLYAAWDMEALDDMDSLDELQACASCRFANRAQWLEASAGLVFVWFDWNFAYLSWV